LVNALRILYSQLYSRLKPSLDLNLKYWNLKTSLMVSSDAPACVAKYPLQLKRHEVDAQDVDSTPLMPVNPFCS